jgi:hypothetical protein
LIKKYPFGAAGSGLSNLLKVIIIVLIAFPLPAFLDQMFDPVIAAVFYSILVGFGFVSTTSFNRATNEKWRLLQITNGDEAQLRSALSPPLLPRLLNQKIVEFLSTFNRSNKPPRPCSSSGPSLV